MGKGQNIGVGEKGREEGCRLGAEWWVTGWIGWGRHGRVGWVSRL